MPEGNSKTPSLIFKWFEKMKLGYENNILAIMKRFEESNRQQQIRLDKAQNRHLNMMQENHVNQVKQYNALIAQQHSEISYFKQQIAQQQQTISQLNNRYDTLVIELLAYQQQKIPLKDIFADNNIIGSDQSTKSANTSPHKENNSNLHTSNIPKNNEHKHNQKSTQKSLRNENSTDTIYLKALAMRDAGNKQQAFIIFKKAAYLGHVLAMGAMGRAYFLAEGVKENPVKGLAWLINAADLQLPQALNRIEFYKNNEPELYQEAKEVAKSIAQAIINTK